MNRRLQSWVLGGLFLTVLGSPVGAQSFFPLDDGAVLPYCPALDDASKVLAIGALLTPVVLVAAPSDQWFSWGLQYTESLILSWGLKELGKNLVQRPRPYWNQPGAPLEARANGDDVQSFPSGHTTLAFTGAAFGTYAFARTFPNSPWTVPLALSAYTLAAGTAALRVTSGSHYVSDVVAGALLGTISGLLVPWLNAEVFGP